MDLLQIKLKKFLSDIESPFSINEVCGYLSGFAVSNQSAESYFPALEMYFSNKLDAPIIQSDYKLILDNIAFIKQRIENGLPIFPFVEQPVLRDQLIALGEWSNNFILSINYLIEHKFLKNTLDFQEILHDLTEISKVGQNYDINDSEETKESYDQISSYVMSAVNHIFIDSREETIVND